MAALTITIGDFKVNVDWLREYDAATPWLDETDRLGFDDGEGELPPFPDESEDEELRAHIGAWAMRAQLPYLRRWHPELCPCDLCLPTRAHGRSLSEVERAMHPSDALAIVNPYRKLGDDPEDPANMVLSPCCATPLSGDWVDVNEWATVLWNDDCGATVGEWQCERRRYHDGDHHAYVPSERSWPNRGEGRREANSPVPRRTYGKCGACYFRGACQSRHLGVGRPMEAVLRECAAQAAQDLVDNPIVVAIAQAATGDCECGKALAGWLVRRERSRRRLARLIRSGTFRA